VLAVMVTMTFTIWRADVPTAPNDAAGLAEAVGSEALATKRPGQWPGYMDRVVIARMYQTGNWTIHAAKDYSLERKIDYVCEALAYLKPSYVSGLVRLDWNEPPEKLAEQAKVFDGIRTCVRHKVDKNVKFDVALNALHYTDPTQPSPAEDAQTGTDLLLKRLDSAQAAFHPDGWYFDFYASPYKNGSHRFHEPLENGIKWIHGDKSAGKPKPRQFVGGTVWGRHTEIPPHSDFLAATDRGGRNYTAQLVESLWRKHHKPILMHIDNSPTDKNSQSSLFYSGERDRPEVIRQHVGDQSVGYRYMFPVFFPTGYNTVNVFDMRQHPDLFQTMCNYARDHCGPPPAAPEHDNSGPSHAPDRPTAPAPTSTAPTTTAPTSTAPTTTKLQGIHRGYHPGSKQHLYSVSLEEVQVNGVQLETENAFYLNPAGGPGLAPLHRCYLGNGWHLLTTDPACEGASGAIDEGPLGYIAATQAPGTVPLYRLFRLHKPDHFFTTSTVERDYAIAGGYTLDGVAGYVWTTPTT